MLSWQPEEKIRNFLDMWATRPRVMGFAEYKSLLFVRHKLCLLLMEGLRSEYEDFNAQ
jgi:hypothetical protein